ncbi:MAG: hypothetical protein EAY75_15330 [Bacteroidetes bacterium]|nr:MAG: hypothetical protein EAY75_15330 [Bacteroidota bacterium]
MRWGMWANVVAPEAALMAAGFIIGVGVNTGAVTRLGAVVWFFIYGLRLCRLALAAGYGQRRVGFATLKAAEYGAGGVVLWRFRFEA